MITIRDLAEQLGVSVATVSRALNDQLGVSPELRQRVLDLAAEMNYRPNVAARNLSTDRTHTVIFMVHRRRFPAAADPFYSYIMHGMEASLSLEGYSIMLLTVTDEQLAQGPQSLPALQEKRADAVVLAGPEFLPGFILSVARLGLTTLLVDNALRETPFPAVLADNEGGSRTLTDHLIKVHGHTHIAFLQGPKGWISCEERSAGYQFAVNAAGLESHIVESEDTTPETGQDAFLRAIKDRPETTAIVASNDAMAIGAMRAARQLGIKMPQEMAIVGFDNIFWSAYADPSLTTVSIPTIEVGRLAARLLLERLYGTVTASSRTIVATQLVIRNSCGCMEAA